LVDASEAVVSQDELLSFAFFFMMSNEEDVHGLLQRWHCVEPSFDI